MVAIARGQAHATSLPEGWPPLLPLIHPARTVTPMQTRCPSARDLAAVRPPAFRSQRRVTEQLGLHHLPTPVPLRRQILSH